MKQPGSHRRIPTIFGILLLVGLVAGTTMLAQSGILFPLRATGSDEPKAVQISNVTDTSFTVSYTTDSPAIGSVTFGETENYGTVTLDERDIAGNSGQPHSIHSITISNLKPQTKYFFAVISGSTTYADNGNPYSVTTATSLPALPGGLAPVTGTIIKPDGSHPTEAIVSVSLDGSQTVSVVAKPDGTYAIPINTLRTSQLTAYQEINDQSILRLNIISDGLLSTIKVTKEHSNPLPPVTVSQDYDFTLNGTDSLTPVATNSASPNTTQGLPQFSTDKAVSTNPQILTPERNQAFSDQQPRFTGTAPPNRSVTIVIHSTQEIRATVKTDKYGNWNYRPTKALTPGTHTIEITTKDEAGFTRTLIQTFVVNAQGSQFTEPSVEPTKTPTPTQTPTPTITPTKTPTPTSGAGVTVTVTPTATTTPVPSITPLPSVTPIPTITPLLPTQIVILPTDAPKPSISPAGSNEVIITVGIASIAMISGAVLFFLTQAGM